MINNCSRPWEIAQGKEMLEDKAAGLDTVIEQGGKKFIWWSKTTFNDCQSIS